MKKFWTVYGVDTYDLVEKRLPTREAATEWAEAHANRRGFRYVVLESVSITRLIGKPVTAEMGADDDDEGDNE